MAYSGEDLGSISSPIPITCGDGYRLKYPRAKQYLPGPLPQVEQSWGPKGTGTCRTREVQQLASWHSADMEHTGVVTGFAVRPGPRFSIRPLRGPQDTTDHGR
jgi:hypothetical protein